MNTLLQKTLLKEPILDCDIEEALYDICDAVHSSCDSQCPVFASNLGRIPKGKDGECKCFKNGQKMLAFMRAKGVAK